VDGARATGIAWHDGSLWLLTTQPAQVLELDPVTGAVRRSVDLRPPFVRAPSSVDTWSLAPASGALWATLPNYGALARIDLRRGQVRYVRIPYGRPFGVSVGPGGAWVATDRAVLLLDETTGALEAGTLVPSASRTGFVSIVFGNAAAWFTNYDRGTLTRVRAPGAP
jgi:streptogramin lyase